MSNYNNYMRNFLSLISKIHDKGNRLIIEELKRNGADGLVPSHGDILVCLYQNDKMTITLTTTVCDTSPHSTTAVKVTTVSVS